MKKITKITLLSIAVALLAALFVPVMGFAATEGPLEWGQAFGVDGYLADYSTSPVWRSDSIGEADRLAEGSLGQMMGTKFVDPPQPEYGIFVNENGPKDIYTGYQSTTYWRTEPASTGYFSLVLLNNRDQIINAGGAVWEFDLRVDKIQDLAVQFAFLTNGAAAGGSNYLNVRIKYDEAGNKVGIYYGDTNCDENSKFAVGEWTHITMAFDASDPSSCVLYVYTSDAGDPNAERKLAFSQGLGSNGSEGTVYPTVVRIQQTDATAGAAYCLDNMVIYGGKQIRNPYYLKSMADDERFAYFVESMLDENVSAAARYATYKGAVALIDVAAASDKAEIQAALAKLNDFIAAGEVAPLEVAAQYANAAEYKRLAESAAALGEDGVTRALSNIANRESAFKAASDFLISVGNVIIENDDYKDATKILSDVSSKIEADKAAKSFISAMDKFYQNYDSGFINAMQGYYNSASEYYVIAKYPQIKDLNVIYKAEDYTDKLKIAIENYENANSFLTTLLNEANSTRVGQIVDLLEEGKALWATDDKYRRMWNAAYQILVIDKSYAADYGTIEEDIARFYAAGGPHEYFWGVIQKEHVRILSEKLAVFNAEGATYIEKAGICTFVDYYIRDNEQYIDATNYEVNDLYTIAKGYSEQLGTLEGDYKLLLAQNTQKFINTVNLMLECKAYVEIKALYDEAREYYYAMDIPDDAAMEAVIAYEAMEDKLTAIEIDCIVFVSVAGKIPYVANDGELYAALVTGYGCYENLDESYAGVLEAKAIYVAQYDEYTAKVDAMNNEVMEMADVVCSVRSFCGITAVVDFVRSLFN